MPSTKSKLVKIVTSEPHEHYEAELARMLGVKRQRVHTIATGEGIHGLIKIYQTKFICTKCGAYARSRLRLCRKCRREYYWVKLACFKCGEPICIKRSKARKDKHHFCSQRCKGEYYGVPWGR